MSDIAKKKDFSMLLLEQVWVFLEGKQRSAEVSWIAIIDVLIH